MGGRKENSLFLIGLSYKTAPVEIREKLSFDFERLPSILSDIYNLEGVRECVVLSTCNRTEIYVTLEDSFTIKRAEEYLVSLSGCDSGISKYFYTKDGEKVIEHLFRVISGLDSMILGEAQIFGQVKNAYSLACDAKTTGTIVNRLFHHAFRVGKHIRNITSFGHGSVSVSNTAVAFAQNLLGSLKNRSVLLVGAGKIGELCVSRLAVSGLREVYIANRTPGKASSLALRLSGKAVLFESIYELSEIVDIIITSVSSPFPIITGNKLAPRLLRRNGKPLILIDLGVPRNIDGEISVFKNAHLYNIDDLEDVIIENRGKRRLDVEKAEEYIICETHNFCRWIREREVVPAIQNLRDKCEEIRREEMERILHRVSPETYNVIDLVTRRLVRKILHHPTVAIRSSESGMDRERLMQSLRELFIEEMERNTVNILQ